MLKLFITPFYKTRSFCHIDVLFSLFFFSCLLSAFYGQSFYKLASLQLYQSWPHGRLRGSNVGDDDGPIEHHVFHLK